MSDAESSNSFLLLETYYFCSPVAVEDVACNVFFSALRAFLLATSLYLSFSLTSLSKPTFFPFLLGFLEELIKNSSLETSFSISPDSLTVPPPNPSSSPISALWAVRICF